MTFSEEEIRANEEMTYTPEQVAANEALIASASTSGQGTRSSSDEYTGSHTSDYSYPSNADSHGAATLAAALDMRAASQTDTAGKYALPTGNTSYSPEQIAAKQANLLRQNPGLTTAQTSLITGGINAGVAAIGSVLNFVSQTASRAQQLEIAQMQTDLQRGNLEMQAAQAQGNRALQLQIAQMQNDRIERTAQLAAAAGAEETARQLQALRRQNQELLAGQPMSPPPPTNTSTNTPTNTRDMVGNNSNRVEETGIPTWAIVAGTAVFAIAGLGLIYWAMSDSEEDEDEGEDEDE